MKKLPTPNGLPAIDGLPTVNLPRPAPAATDPLRAAMQDIGPAAMRWFKEVHRREIIVWAGIAEQPGGRRDIVFKFRFPKPGMIPTAIEKRGFNAFIAGYRAAINIALSLAEPESSVIPS